MRKSVRSKAEEQFATGQKKAKQALKEKEKAQFDMAERMARQKGLRLAKEAADREIADQEAAAKVATKKK